MAGLIAMPAAQTRRLRRRKHASVSLLHGPLHLAYMVMAICIVSLNMQSTLHVSALSSAVGGERQKRVSGTKNVRVSGTTNVPLEHTTQTMLGVRREETKELGGASADALGLTLGVDYYPEQWPLDEMKQDMNTIKVKSEATETIRSYNFVYVCMNLFIT